MKTNRRSQAVLEREIESEASQARAAGVIVIIGSLVFIGGLLVNPLALACGVPMLVVGLVLYLWHGEKRRDAIKRLDALLDEE